MKKPTDITHALVAFLLFMGGMALTGCATDEDIDLNEIDTHIGIGSDGFTLPSNSTNAIMLRDILEIKEGDVIDTLKNGDYRFVKADKVSTSNPKVKQVSFDSPSVTPSGFTVNVPSVPPTGWTSQDIGPASVTVFNHTSSQETNIVKLSSANATGTMKLTLGIDALKSYFSKVTVSLDLPYYLKFKDDVSGGTFNRDDTNKKQTLVVEDLSTASPQTITLNISGLEDVKQSKPTGVTNYIVVNENGIDLNGSVALTLTLKQANFIPTTTSSISTSIAVGATLSSIVVNQATGYFNPTIDPMSSSVDITGIPDFLNDPEVSIKLANPEITLSITNNVNLETIIDGTMTATYDDNSTKILKFSKDNVGNNIVIKPHTGATSSSTASKIVICRVPGTESGTQYVVKDGTGTKTDVKEVLDLQELLINIPKKLEFAVTVKSNTSYKGTIDLYDPNSSTSTTGKEYKIDPQYNFEAPLTMDLTSTIVYKDSINDFNKDFKKNEIELVDGAQLVLNSKVNNTTPMKMYLTPTAFSIEKDAQGICKPLTGIQVTLTTDTKDANGYYIPSNYGSSTTSNMKIVMKSNDPQLYRKLEGLSFRVKAVTDVAGVQLNSHKQVLHVQDMIITLTGPVSINVDSGD